MQGEERNVELRFVIRTDMDDHRLEEFTQEIAKEIKEHLIEGEDVLTTLVTDKVSYESVQLMKELGVN